MFEKNYKKIRLDEIKSDLEFDRLPTELSFLLQKLKNSLKLSKGVTPKPPILREAEWFGVEEGIENFRYMVVNGHFTVYAAKLLQQEREQYDFLYCLVCSQPEAKVLDNLLELQNGMGIF